MKNSLGSSWLIQYGGQIKYSGSNKIGVPLSRIMYKEHTGNEDVPEYPVEVRVLPFRVFTEGLYWEAAPSE